MYGYDNQIPKNRKVVVYARVSTEHEAQLSALENQKDWYKPILAQHPEWEVVRMYVDEGITGTSAKKRPQFMQMIEDAEDGEFDLILTREVSRFARNTVDTLQYTRSLKAKGVEVFFINDNIKTFDGDGELRLTIMATLAQDESRKTSIRVKSGQQTSMNNGVFYGNGNILGYDRVGKNMVINPEQAKTVRMIYDWYLDGIGIRAIQFKLEQAGRLTSTGKTNWHMANISKILKNSFYCGIITYHKQWTPDFLEQKKINNIGDMEFTVVKGTHEPIVTEEEFELVQKKIGSRHRESKNNQAGKKRVFGERQPSDVWTELLVCECGHKFNRKVWHRLENEVQYGYQCYSSIRTGTVKTRQNKGLPTEGICAVPMIAGWKLQMMAKHIFREYLKDTAQVLALAESILDRHIDDKEPVEDSSKIIKQKQDEREKLNKRLHNLIEMRADGEITREVFKIKQEEIEKRLAEIDTELETLNPETQNEVDEATHDEKITILRYYLEQSVNPSDTDDIPEDVIRAFVIKIVAHEDGFDWYLRFSPDKDPKKLSIEGKRKDSAKVSSLGYLLHRLQSKRKTLNYRLTDKVSKFKPCLKFRQGFYTLKYKEK
ncbi:MAG: recombinase family protein [Ruminococcus sp.]|nr:recombinase family protein [Ruminococcus sp.]